MHRAVAYISVPDYLFFVLGNIWINILISIRWFFLYGFIFAPETEDIINHFCAVSFIGNDTVWQFPVCSPALATFQNSEPELNIRFVCFQFALAGSPKKQFSFAIRAWNRFRTRNNESSRFTNKAKQCYTNHDLVVRRKQLFLAENVLDSQRKTGVAASFFTFCILLRWGTSPSDSPGFIAIRFSHGLSSIPVHLYHIRSWIARSGSK